MEVAEKMMAMAKVKASVAAGILTVLLLVMCGLAQAQTAETPNTAALPARPVAVPTSQPASTQATHPFSPQDLRFLGEVLKVDDKSITISLNYQQGIRRPAATTKTFALDKEQTRALMVAPMRSQLAETRIVTAKLTPIELSDLKVGQSVAIAAEGDLATHIEVLPPGEPLPIRNGNPREPGGPGPTTIARGSITKLDGDSLTVDSRVPGPTGLVTVVADDNSQVLLDGQRAYLDDLKERMSVRVTSYPATGRFPARLEISASSPLLRGTMVRLDGRNVIVLVAKPDGTASEVTVPTNDQTEITDVGVVGGRLTPSRSIHLEDLVEGMRLSILPETGMAKRIAVLPQGRSATRPVGTQPIAAEKPAATGISSNEREIAIAEAKSDGGSQTSDSKLNKANEIPIRILTPDGKPATGADAAVATALESVEVRDGAIVRRQTRAAIKTVDSEGVYLLPPLTQPKGTVLITHPNGYIEMPYQEVAKAKELRLNAWGKVEAVLKVGANVAGQRMEMYRLEGHWGDEPILDQVEERQTDANGRCVFDHVPAGKVNVGNVVLVFGEKVWSQSHVKLVTVEAGGSVPVEIGGEGRPVAGRVEIPADMPVGWQFGGMIVSLKTLRLPTPQGFRSWSPETRQAWTEEWRKSDAGKAYTRLEEEESRKARIFCCRVNADGTFRIEDIPAGTYTMRATLQPSDYRGRPNRQLGVATGEFTMPEVPGGKSSEVLDVGVLEVKRQTAATLPSTKPNSAK